MTDTLIRRKHNPSLRLRPTRQDAEDAVRVLLAWSGDDPDREALQLTPQRVVDAYKEYFQGYAEDPQDILAASEMDDVGGYDDIVMLRGIHFTSHCEHHLSPFVGVANVAYVPGERVVGLSKLARIVDVFAHRLQTQENMTAEISDALVAGLNPRGVAVLIEAEHQCIAARGLRRHGMSAVTHRFTGTFNSDPSLRDRFMQLAKG